MEQEQVIDTVADGVATLIRDNRTMHHEIIELNQKLGVQAQEIKKLRGLILLTDPALSNIPMNEISMIQWQEYSEWKSRP